MGQLCFISNIAPRYREPIFRLIDEEWDVDWYFGRNETDIAGIHDGVLKSTTFTPNTKVVGPFYKQKGYSKLISDSRYSTILALGEPFCLSTWSLLIKRRLFYKDKRIFLWTHGWYGREGIAKRLMKRIFFGMSDKVLVYSDYGRKVAIAQGFPAEKLEVIHNSLDHTLQKRLRDSLKPSGIYRKIFGNDFPVLLFIGRLTAVKRLDVLLRAMKILTASGKRYNLMLIGDGPERTALEALSEELGLGENIHFKGESYDELENSRLIYEADLCVAPGNVGLTAIHTMVFGLPVITHDDFPWQMPEFEAIIPRRTGAFFKRNSPDSLADAINDWFEGPGKDRDRVRRACYAEIDTNWTPAFQLEVLRHTISPNSTTG